MEIGNALEYRQIVLSMEASDAHMKMEPPFLSPFEGTVFTVLQEN